MEVDLRGRSAGIMGARHAIAEAVAAALAANQANVVWVAPGADDAIIDVLILSHDLVPPGTTGSALLVDEAARIAGAMAARGGGRIVHLISATGVIAMRRHAAFSAAAAGIAASVKALAMNAAPGVLINAVAAGAIGEPEAMLAGDGAMLSHVPLGRTGTTADIANAVLFLVDPANSYTTGLVLTVDGGWTAGYGRNF